MEPVKLLDWRVIWFPITISCILAAAVNSAPVSIDFNVCEEASFPENPQDLTGPTLNVLCCPIKPTKPIIDGGPPPSTKELRVRKASQCTDAEYAAKIQKGYALMRALPDDDPRSFRNQWYLHCSYCGGSFLTRNSTGGAEPVDIHYSWLFFPWHRWYLFFHERILQSLLDDPTFSLNYWNWDNPYTIGQASKDGECLDQGDNVLTGFGQANSTTSDDVRSPNANEFGTYRSPSEDGECLAQGHNFPTVFSHPNGTTYDDLRSPSAKGLGTYRFPNFDFIPGIAAAAQPNVSATEEDLILTNMNIAYQTLVSGATTAETFMGRPYRYGEEKGNASRPDGGAGSLEGSMHATVHFWTGTDPPSLNDMGQLAHSARDPVFFAHHGNIDRLFQVWKDIGPIVGQKREYYSDPDFLNANFLFYDENKDLRRVKVEDALDTKKLGYVYQAANDDAWIYPNLTSCSTLTFEELIAQAEHLHVPHKHHGYYYLEAGTPFVLVIDRPDNPHGLEEFLTIHGIKLDRTSIAGFDVYVDLLNPNDYKSPGKCAEYNGRFSSMAQSRQSSKALVWKQSVTRTFVDIQAPTPPGKVVITIIPFSQAGRYETIKFKSVTIGF
ncbi:unnamed protein product [Calypogeia fissa]